MGLGKLGKLKQDYGMRYPGEFPCSVKESPCTNCRYVAGDCPRSDELDQFGEPVRLFVERCNDWKPYQQPRPECGYVGALRPKYY